MVRAVLAKESRSKKAIDIQKRAIQFQQHMVQLWSIAIVNLTVLDEEGLVAQSDRFSEKDIPIVTLPINLELYDLEAQDTGEPPP